LIRLVQEKDRETLLKIGENFIDEGGYNDEPDFDILNQGVDAILDQGRPETVGLVYEKGGFVVGFCYFTVASMFTKRPWCFPHVIYAFPEYRNGLVIHRLVKEMLRFCEDANVSNVFITSTGNLGEENDEAFVRLFEHFGFKQLGPTLVREM